MAELPDALAALRAMETAAQGAAQAGRELAQTMRRLADTLKEDSNG